LSKNTSPALEKYKCPLVVYICWWFLFTNRYTSSKSSISQYRFSL